MDRGLRIKKYHNGYTVEVQNPNHPAQWFWDSHFEGLLSYIGARYRVWRLLRESRPIPPAVVVWTNRDGNGQPFLNEED